GLLFQSPQVIGAVLLGVLLSAVLPAAVFSLSRGLRGAWWAFPYGVYNFLCLSWITPYALLTSHRSAWLTRQLPAASAVESAPCAVLGPPPRGASPRAARRGSRACSPPRARSGRLRPPRSAPAGPGPTGPRDGPRCHPGPVAPVRLTVCELRQSSSAGLFPRAGSCRIVGYLPMLTLLLRLVRTLGAPLSMALALLLCGVTLPRAAVAAPMQVEELPPELRG